MNSHSNAYDPQADLARPLPDTRCFHLIACEIFYREICLLIAHCPHIINVTFLRKGLHDAGRDTMCQTLQESIDAVPSRNYEAVLLAYGRCNDGVKNLHARDLPLVIPRAHDCITVFFGSRQAYEKYFDQHPGTYFRTTGWTERGSGDDDSVMAQLGLNQTYQQYVDKYGKENADYIIQSLGSWEQNYKYLAYIDMGLELDPRYAELTRREAQQRNLQFQRLTGDLSLIRNLLYGNWDPDDFLVVPPGSAITTDDDGQILNTA